MAAARTGLPPAENDPLERGESEEEEEVESGEEGGDDWSEPANLADLYEPDAGSDEDPSFDPVADRGPEGEAALWSGMARLSISARKGRKGSVAPKMEKEDSDLLAMVDKLMRDGQLDKLKVYECKAYLRMHKLRLSGKKEELINRIREHIEVKNLGEVKYPVSSFVLNCKGDACKGDVVVFEQNIYRRKKGDPRGVKGRLCGQRTNAGRIIKESYGTAKQQHTFTVEILWSKGYKPWPPLHPLLIKGRNLYKDKTMRQPWSDEQERSRVLQEKHARGFLARKSREVRIHEKEIGKMRRFNRITDNTSRGKENVDQISSQKIPQQKVMSTNIVDQRFDERMTPSLQHGQPGNASQQQLISSKQNPATHLLHQQQPYHQHCNEVLLRDGAARTSMPEFITHQFPSIQHVKPQKRSQQQVLSRPSPAYQILKHPTQHNDHGPTPAQHMFKHLQDKVLWQEDTTRTFSILGQAPPCLQREEHAMPQEKILKPTPIGQIRNQPQPLKQQHQNAVLLQQGTKIRNQALPLEHQHQNAVLLQQDAKIRNQALPLEHQHQNAVLLQQGAKKETYRVHSVHNRNYDSTESGKTPCIPQHMGAVNARQQHISSKPTLPLQIKNPPRFPKHQHHNEVLRQEGGKRNYRVESVGHQHNTHHSTDYGESSFQHHGAQHGNTHQYGSNGHQHDQVDHQWHHPLRPSNKNSCSANQVEYHCGQGKTTRYGRRQTTQDQYNQTQKIHQQNRHDDWRMNHDHYHPRENHRQNYQFSPLKLCRYYQRGSWCPYEENCKFSHCN